MLKRNIFVCLFSMVCFSGGLQALTQLDQALIDAAKAGDVFAIEDALDAGANVNAIDEDRETALHWAAYNGHKNAVRELLQREGINANKLDKLGLTPLMRAIQKEHYELVQVFKQGGVDVDFQSPRKQCTALHFATQKFSLRCCLALLACGADPLKKNAAGCAPVGFVSKREEEYLQGKISDAEIFNLRNIRQFFWSHVYKNQEGLIAWIYRNIVGYNFKMVS
jgi:ankyrin repeat protein